MYCSLQFFHWILSPHYIHPYRLLWKYRTDRCQSLIIWTDGIVIIKYNFNIFPVWKLFFILFNSVLLCFFIEKLYQLAIRIWIICLFVFKIKKITSSSKFLFSSKSWRIKFCSCCLWLWSGIFLTSLSICLYSFKTSVRSINCRKTL